MLSMPMMCAELHADRVDDEAREEVLAEHLARQLAAEVLTGPRAVHVVGAVEAVEEVRDPAGAALGERELDVGELLDHARPEDVGGRLQMFIGCSVIITSTGAFGAVTTSWPDEPRCTEMTMSWSTHAVQNGSQYSSW